MLPHVVGRLSVALTRIQGRSEIDMRHLGGLTRACCRIRGAGWAALGLQAVQELWLNLAQAKYIGWTASISLHV